MPAFLLPSLVTSMLGNRDDDTYLVEDFTLFDACGTDVVAAYKQAGDEAGGRPEACRAAYPQALQRYRRNVVDLGPDG